MRELFLTYLLLYLSVSSETITNQNGYGKGSLVFVFDTTGSMYNDLKQLREGAEMILDTAMEAGNAVSNFVFVPFHDPGVGPATVTTDKHVFKNVLSELRVHGGGNCPEKSLSGLTLALQTAKENSFVYVFSDASAGDYEAVGKVLDEVQRRRGQVSFVLTGHCNDVNKPNYQVYHKIAAASSGQVFNLNKTSVYKVLEFVRSSIRGRTVNLGFLVNSPGYNLTQEIPIDSALSEVTVSVSGAKPQIQVTDPQGEILTPPKLQTTLDLDEIMVVKVFEPSAGNWSITVGSEGQYSVKVAGISNLTFTCGFSVKKPENIAETSYRPLRGTYNYMVVSPTQAAGVSIERAEILDLNGKLLFEVLLKKIGGNYITEPFVPPEELFYVAINGHDENNQELRRVSSTAVQPKLPDAPYLRVQETLTAHIHERVILTCHIDSLVPVTAQWVKNSNRIMRPVTSSQSTTIQYVIEDASEDHSGTYVCHASNEIDRSKATTLLDVTVDLPEVTISPQNITTMLGEKVTIHCAVISEATLVKWQLIFNGTHKQYEFNIPVNKINKDFVYTYNKTINTNEHEDGVLTCRAKNKAGETIQSTNLTILSPPKVHPYPSIITATLNSTVTLHCKVENVQELHWVAPNNSVVKVSVIREGSIDSLVIDKVGLGDEGYWYCVGLNNRHRDAEFIYLNLTIQTQVSITQVSNDIVLYGDRLNLSCTVISKSVPTVTWRFENGTILNSSVTESQRYVYTCNVTVNNITESNQGTYYCSVEGGGVYERDSISIRVRKPITIHRHFAEITHADLNSQIELHCEPSGHPLPDIMWLHNNSYIFFDDNIHISADRQTLYIDSVDIYTVGLYTCIVENEFEVIHVLGSVFLNEFELPLLSKEPVRRITQKGKSAIITCSILKGKPLPTLAWEFKSISSDTFTPIPDDIQENGTELVIAKVDSNHSGIYRCLAKNTAGTDQYDVELVVQYPPQISQQHTNNTDTKLVHLGSKVTLNCGATGEPKPFITWVKDGRPVVYSSRVYLSPDYELVIEESYKHDSGNFTCKATSHLGSVNRNIALVVYGEPEINDPQIPLEIEVLEGQLIELPCDAYGTPAPFVEWRRNGKTLPKSERKHVDENKTLRFIANLTDFGDYSCIATNTYGNASITYEVLIWAPPSLEGLKHQKVDVLTNKTVKLQCNAVGYPIPEIIWKVNKDILTENTTKFAFNTIGDLSIDKVEVSDESVYVCVARNRAGDDKKYFHLRVNERPSIKREIFSGPYVASDMDTELTVPCRSTGRPRPFLTWGRDGVFLDHDDRYNISLDGSLTIKHPTVNMAGSYTCVAKNSVGVANKTVNIQVYALPAYVSDEARSEVTVLEGSNYTLACPLECSADCTEKWYKDANLISTGPLHFTLVTTNSTGLYHCVVQNAIISHTATVIVKVEMAPKFMRDEKLALKVVKLEDVLLSCEVKSLPTAEVTWYFNSKVLISEKNPYFKLLNIQTHNDGIYKCVVQNKHGTITREYTLQVLEPPKISEVDNTEVLLKVGSNATLKCDATGNPRPDIIWSYDNPNWHLSHPHLSSTNITTNSTGIFICTATNEAGSARLVYRVVVISPPTVGEIVGFSGDGGGTSVEGKMRVTAGIKIRISCRASGMPTPNIRWLKNGNTIAENTGNTSYTDLLIDRVNMNNSGFYVCVATNEGGSDEKIVEIDVLEPPKISTNLLQKVQNVSYQHIEILSGRKFYLHCHPQGNPPPYLYWFKDQNDLMLFDSKMEFTDFGEVIVVYSASSEQSGNYTCVARNQVGEASFSYFLEVLVPPPQPKDHSNPIHIHFGDQLNLTCPVEGFPIPSVSWVKLPYLEISEAMNDRIVLGEFNKSLSINNIQIIDTGTYVCRMTNKAGVSSATFTVEVVKAPSIDKTVNDVVVNKGDSFVLNCDVDGYPEPIVDWYKDDQPLHSATTQLSSNNRVLVTWEVDSRSAGKYACYATNAAGRDYRTSWVRVRVPGKWSMWSGWGYCNVTCGLGYQHRNRTCQYIDDFVTIEPAKNKSSEGIILDESMCTGRTVDRRKCHMPACEEEPQEAVESRPHWSSWSKWSVCSVSCGVGTQTRTRICRSEEIECDGDNLQIRKCPNLPSCDIKTYDLDLPQSGEGSTEYLYEYIPEVAYEHIPDRDDLNPEIHQDVEAFDVDPVPPNISPSSFEVSVNTNLDRSNNGPCPYGYKYNDHTQDCDDINECELNLNTCKYSCVNTPGAFVCGCPKGLRLHTDKMHCVNPSDYKTPYYQIRRRNRKYLSTKLKFPPKSRSL